MEINNLIEIIEEKLKKNIKIESLNIEDKSFLHKKHKYFNKDKFHIKLDIISFELKQINLVEANKRIHKILKKEIKDFIHSLQIKIT